MADLSEANKNKIAAKRNFTRARKSLSHAVDAREDIELVEQRYISFKEKWAIVLEKYEMWMKFQPNYDDEDAVQDETWIEDLEGKFNDLERCYITLVKNDKMEMEELNRRTEESKIDQRNADIERAYSIAADRSKGKRLAEQKALYGQCDYMSNVLSDTSSEISVPSLQGLQRDLKEQFQRCKLAHGALLECLNKEDIKDEVDWICKIQDVYLNVIKRSTLCIDNKLKAATGPEIKLEPMKLSTFNGDIRSFPRFKTDFNKYIKPRVSADSCPYILKTCLIGSVLQNLIRNVDDDITKMWERLDEKYGRAPKLVEVILKDIRSVRLIRCEEGKELISFIDMLEAGYQDLKMIRYENEFSNTTVTSLIESKLPKDVRREWAKEINKRDTTVTDENKFERLLEFLKELRRIVEYDLSDVRSHDVETPRMKNIQT